MRAPLPARVFLADGREVLITLTCTKCRRTMPLARFGLRRMGNGEIRSISQCKACRSTPTPPVTA